MGTLVLAGVTSGATTLTPADTVTTVLTLPSSTATLATLGANTFAGNQSITGTLGVTGVTRASGGLNTGPTDFAAFAAGDIMLPSSNAYRVSYSGFGYNVLSISGGIVTVDAGGLGATFGGTLGVTGVVSAPILRSTSPDPNDVSVATSTATTIFSASTYLIGRNGMLFSVMDDATIFGVGLVLKNSNGSLVVTTIFSQGSGFALSISSTNVQFTQTVGTTRTIKTRMWPSFSV